MTGKLYEETSYQLNANKVTNDWMDNDEVFCMIIYIFILPN